jgi:hypothetical protein
LGLAEGTAVPAAEVALQAVAEEGLPPRGVGWEPADSRVEAELAQAPGGQRRGVARATLGPAALAAWLAPLAWRGLGG